MCIDQIYSNNIRILYKNMNNIIFEDDILKDENNKWLGYAPGRVCRYIESCISGNVINVSGALDSKIHEDIFNPKIYITKSVLNTLKDSHDNA